MKGMAVKKGGTRGGMMMNMDDRGILAPSEDVLVSSMVQRRGSKAGDYNLIPTKPPLVHLMLLEQRVVHGT